MTAYKKHNMKNFHLIIFSGLFTLLSYAQDLPNVVPPSPEAQAFQKYGDIPVSTYTGVPNISIPLYTVAEGDISVPISVNYHASGIKVAEEASRVGLGFVLNAQGMISRTVVGKDDFGQLNSYHNGGIPTLNMSSQYFFPTFPLQQGDEIDVPNNSPLNLNTDFISAATEIYDFEPDQYSYNFMGYSGKFILTPNKEVILATKEKIIIECMDSNANTWEVWTPDGMHYFFEVFDAYRGELNQFVKSSWYLTKVQSPKGHEISFNYEDLGNQYIRPLGSFQEVDNSQHAQAGGSCGDISRPSIEQAVPGKEYIQIRLQSIDFDLGVVEFNYGTRDDLEGDSKLENIEVFKKLNDIKASLPFKGFQFNYDYFETIYNGNFNNSSFSKKRLKLLSVNEVGYTGGVAVHMTPHKFEYEQNVNLPSKTSFSRDHWGYYNGQPNLSLIPEFTVVPGTFTVQGLIGVMGTERNTNPNKVVAGSLRKITYPTGGSTEFFYEAHDYDSEESSIDPYFHSQPYIKKSHGVAYNSKGFVDEGWIDLTDMYVIEETELVAPTTFTVKFRASESCGNVGDLFGNDTSYYRLYNANDILVHEISIGSPNTSCDGSIFYTYFNEAGQNQLILEPGMYRWEAFIPNDGFGGDGLEDIHATYTYKAINTPEANGAKYYYAGGLRIQKIVNKDNIDPNNDQIRTFQYNYKEDRNNDGIEETYSHGILKAYPRYCYFDPMLIQGCNVAYLVRSSSSTIPLYSNPVGYSEVTVFQEGNGKSVFSYHNEPNRNLYYAFYSSAYGLVVPARPPFKPVVEDDFSGLLENRTDYLEKNGLFHKVKELVNLYDILGAHNFNSLYYGIEFRRHNAGNVWSNMYDVAYIYPAMLSNFINLTNTSENIYDENDNSKYIHVNTSYEYDYDSHLQLKKKIITDSKGREVSTIYRYPDEVEFVSSLGLPNLSVIAKSAIDLLKENAQYRVGEVIQTETTVIDNGTLLSSTRNRTDYSDDWTNINLVLPEFVKTLKGNYSATNNLEERIRFHSYDNLGNPTGVSKSGGIKIAYIWGYNKMYPVAKVENATYDAVMATGVNESVFNNSATTDNTMRTELDKIRAHTNMQNARVTTYTYDPLVGVTSMTDSRGYTIYYEYDVFNRLKEVKDADGNLLTDYEYHYKGQNQQ